MWSCDLYGAGVSYLSEIGPIIRFEASKALVLHQLQLQNHMDKTPRAGPPKSCPPPRSWPPKSWTPKASPSRISRLHECAPYQGVQSVLSVSGQQRLWFWFTVLVHGCVVPADWLGVFMAHSEQCGANTSLKAKACSFTSGLVSEYSFTRSTATMLFSRSDVIRTIQFRDMVTWGAESDLRS